MDHATFELDDALDAQIAAAAAAVRAAAHTVALTDALSNGRCLFISAGNVSSYRCAQRRRAPKMAQYYY